MIIGFLKLAVFGLIGMTVVYLLLSVYSRSVQREELEKRFDAGDGDGARDAYIEAGMRDYEKSLRKKLIWLVYVIPAIVFVAVFYGLNFG